MKNLQSCIRKSAKGERGNGQKRQRGKRDIEGPESHRARDKALHTRKNMVQKAGAWVLTAEASAKLHELEKRQAAIEAKIAAILKPIGDQMKAERAERAKAFKKTLRDFNG
jgi:hypothetical protein